MCVERFLVERGVVLEVVRSVKKQMDRLDLGCWIFIDYKYSFPPSSENLYAAPNPNGQRYTPHMTSLHHQTPVIVTGTLKSTNHLDPFVVLSRWRCHMQWTRNKKLVDHHV